MNTVKFGVPGSLLANHIKDADVPCTSEGEAMALAAGAWLAGKKPTVYMQNSGLGDCMDIITSLYIPYGIPLPELLLGWRETPEQHKAMGEITQEVLVLQRWVDITILREAGAGIPYAT